MKLLLIIICLFTSTARAEAVIKSPAPTAHTSEFEYEVKKEKVYEKKIGSSEKWTQMKDSSEVKSIIVFKDKLYALQKNGSLWLWKGKGTDGYWINVETSVRELYAIEDLLYVVTNYNQLRKYGGSPFSSRFRPVAINGYFQGQKVFTPLEFKGVKSLKQEKNKVLIVFKNGKEQELPSTHFFNTTEPVSSMEPGAP